MIDISVIMPVYNCEKYLKDTIESILHQSQKNIELILVNDGSTDNSLNILRYYEKKDNRVTVISQENRGYFYALNEARKIAKGKYIYPVDSDDLLATDVALEKMFQLAEKENADVVFIDAYVKAPDQSSYYLASHVKSKNSYDVYDITDGGSSIYNKYRFKDAIAQWFCMVRRDIHGDTPWPHQPYTDYFMLFQRLKKAKIIAFLHEPLYIYHNPREGSMVNTYKSNINKLHLFHHDKRIYHYEEAVAYFGYKKEEVDFLVKFYIIAYYHIDHYVKDDSYDFVKQAIIKRLVELSKYCSLKNKIRIFAMRYLGNFYKYRDKRIY